MEFFKKNNLINVKILFIFLILSILLAIGFNYFLIKFNIQSNFWDNGFNEFNIFLKFFLVVVISPVLETIITNLIPIVILEKLIKNKYIIVFLASLLFAVLHWYSIYYVIFAFFGGILLNSFFIIIQNKSNTNKAVIFTILYHSLYNLFGFILLEILKIEF